MKRSKSASRSAGWTSHDEAFRTPEAVAAQWPASSAADPALLAFEADRGWWEVLESRRITLLMTREYEHALIALRVHAGKPDLSYWPVPHPSGLLADRARRGLFLVSTRNPNVLFHLKPVGSFLPRHDARPPRGLEGTLVPVRARFLPGCLYLHDLAWMGSRLYGAAVGMNAVVRLDDRDVRPVWWPRCIETPAGPAFGRNFIQLNSVASDGSLADSFVTASCDRMGRSRPGHRRFAVDARGVIFSGRTREPVVRGLTRPHSARMHDQRLWVANSGYGEVGVVRGDRFECVCRLPGWSRGIGFHQDVLFAGFSRILPRFQQYAPGLDPSKSSCGIAAIDIASGRLLGRLIWPSGNQIFGIDWLPAQHCTGLPLRPGAGMGSRVKRLFYLHHP